MTVRELVGGEAIYIELSETLLEATRTMSSSDIGAIPVVEDSQLVGILSERDVVRACAQDANLTDETAADWMTRGPDFLDPDVSVDEAADWMLGSGYRHLPVVDGRDLIGVVSIKDVLWALTEPATA